MSRKYLDEEEDYALSNRVERVGYDADTQQYTFRNIDTERLYTNTSGQRYGPLRPASGRGPGIPGETVRDTEQAWWFMFPFFALVGLTLLLFIAPPWTWWGEAKLECSSAAEKYVIDVGDTCFEIAQKFGTTVESLKKLNEGLDCRRLKIGGGICAPSVQLA